jgi:glycosyltransferase involved in cell wall biosynthesis
MKISIILPIYNEERNISILYEELRKELLAIKSDYEIIAVNDGSRDASLVELKKIAGKDDNFRIIDFRYNFGQTAALSAGIKSAEGDLIIPMDSDLQNDPADIHKFLSKIEEGYDVVSGWRKERWQGSFFSRKLPSIMANRLIAFITGVRIHDYGCTMKAYRRELIQGVNLYGEMHRFVAAYASWRGGKVAEIVVNSRERIHGNSNYGISRTFKVLLDLIVFKFMSKYMNRPIHFFGGLGFLSLFLGFLVGSVAIILRLLEIKYISETPLPILSTLFIIVGVQLVAMGVIAEMNMRIYYESQRKEPYVIREKINFN